MRSYELESNTADFRICARGLLFVQVDELSLDAAECCFAQRGIDIDIHRVHQSISIARNACGKRILDLLQAFEPVLTRGFDGRNGSVMG